MNVGRVCVKIAGREAGSFCVIIERGDKTFALIDGPVKRRKCNIVHLEPTNKVVDVSKSMDKKEILDRLAALGLISAEEVKLWNEKKPHISKPRPAKVKKVKVKAKKEVKKEKVREVKKEESKVEKKKEEKQVKAKKEVKKEKKEVKEKKKVKK